MIFFEDVSKRFPNGTMAVADLSLEIAAGETVVLLGTSGSGKTTTMKMINRLIEVSSGRVMIGGQDVRTHDVTELRRKIGYAIQHIGLFPHMTVAENIAVVPRLLRWEESRVARRNDELLATVGLAPDVYRDRYPSELSGGQRQRIGVARALAADPPIVLMDEPFGALDPITREQLQDEFLELESKIQKTVVFVTHDIFEAVKMADRIVLMDDGRIQQVATPAELIDRPANAFVDQFIGQHRMQLTLLTRTIKSLVEPFDEDGARPAAEGGLSVRDTLIGSLDAFKRRRGDVLVVSAAGKAIGKLYKKTLLAEITRLLADEGGGA